jgi:hypothetical protein
MPKSEDVSIEILDTIGSAFKGVWQALGDEYLKSYQGRKNDGETTIQASSESHDSDFGYRFRIYVWSRMGCRRIKSLKRRGLRDAKTTRFDGRRHIGLLVLLRAG